MQAFRPLQRYFDFSGRSGRAEYWQFIALTTVLGWITQIVDSGRAQAYGDAFPKTTAIFAVVTLIPTVAAAFRRLHDSGKSGWYYIALVGGLSVAAILLLVGNNTNQRSGDTGLLGIGLIGFVLALAYLIYVIVLLARPGDAGINAYGPADSYTPPAAGGTSPVAWPTIRPRPGAEPAPLDGQIAAIERLGSLRDKGLISEAEFTAQKQRILDQL